MAKAEQIRQGGNLTLTYDRDGKSISGWTCDVYIKQYALDTSTIIKLNIDVDPNNPDQWSANLKPSDTLLLRPGLWYAFSNLTLGTPPDEQARQIAGRTIRFQVAGTIVVHAEFILLEEGDGSILLEEGDGLIQLQESE